MVVGVYALASAGFGEIKWRRKRQGLGPRSTLARDIQTSGHAGVRPIVQSVPNVVPMVQLLGGTGLLATAHCHESPCSLGGGEHDQAHLQGFGF